MLCFSPYPHRYLPKDAVARLTINEAKFNRFQNFQAIYSGVSCSRMFLFQGSPDIILKKSGDPDDDNDMIVDIVTMESDSESEDERVVECSRGTLTMKSASPFPEKIGQLIAELHFVAAAAIIRKLVKVRRLVKSMKTKGILIDKLNGIIHCEVVVSADKTLQVSCVDNSGKVTNDSLCQAFQDLLK